MNTKLDNITAQYRKFNENQALTEGQLNEFIDYFEDQDRLSRTRLSGTGIVCGFKTTSSFGFANVVEGPILNGLGISQGAGVTTDGDLITLRNSQEGVKEVSIDFDGKIFTHYKTYEDIHKYPHFSEVTSLIELRNEADIIGEEANFSLVDPTILNGKVVLLYLESYVNEESPCQDADCDNQGEEQVSELRVLIVSTSDAENIINGTKEDTIYNRHNEFEVLYDSLPNIEVSRAFLTADITTEDQVRAKFKNAIERDAIISKLSTGFESISNIFNVTINVGGQTLSTLLSSLLNTTGTDFQYRYDLLKDLVATYNEIKNLLLHLKVECCPSIHSFPKHIMLGPVDASLELGENTAYRHDFYKSPILTDEDENYVKAVLLTNRFVQKIENFRKFIGSVRITPSKKDVHLGDKAVPFYYNVTNALLETWDYEHTENDKEDYNLSYHKGNLASEDFIQNPLNYNLDDNNFFRIEGHLGQSYKIAYENINRIKTAYGLPFDIKTIMLRRKSAVTDGPVRALPTAELPTADTKQISIAGLRQQLLEVSDGFVSSDGTDQQETLETIANLDYQLNLLNEVEALTKPSLPQDGGVTVVTQDPKDNEIESELLSDFMERHSGLEHFAGVEPGGTFILLHESEDKGQVIADFSLPYLCCSKKDPVFLVLPAAEICENDMPIPMTVIPIDGEIKAFDGLTQITGITTSGGQSFLNPSLVPTTSHGNPITFTVNDDPVETQITVHAQPQESVVTEVSYGDANSPTADVKFILSNYNSSYTYTWNYGDGSPVETNPVVNDSSIMHTYNLVVGEEDTYNPTVTVTNTNGCSTLVNIEPLSLKLVINRNTQIRIYFDSSGSMNSSLAPLTTMKDGILKNTLLPLYDNDLAAYNDKVRIRNYGNERTMNVLNLEGETPPEGNVIVLVFQDESSPNYHGTSISPRKALFDTDLAAFKSRLANNFGTGNSNYYRGIVFQVDGNTTFRTLMQAVETGNQTDYASTNNNLTTEVGNGQVQFQYDIVDGDTSQNYFNIIKAALESFGYDIPDASSSTAIPVSLPS